MFLLKICCNISQVLLLTGDALPPKTTPGPMVLGVNNCNGFCHISIV